MTSTAREALHAEVATERPKPFVPDAVTVAAEMLG